MEGEPDGFVALCKYRNTLKLKIPQKYKKALNLEEDMEFVIRLAETSEEKPFLVIDNRIDQFNSSYPERSLFSQGNSLAITIPVKYARELGVTEGDFVSVDLFLGTSLQVKPLIHFHFSGQSKSQIDV
ncbi:MAG: hypothetical protein R6U96_01820 [Promethearchaeia archaeon]